MQCALPQISDCFNIQLLDNVDIKNFITHTWVRQHVKACYYSRIEVKNLGDLLTYFTFNLWIRTFTPIRSDFLELLADGRLVKKTRVLTQREMFEFHQSVENGQVRVKISSNVPNAPNRQINHSVLSSSSDENYESLSSDSEKEGKTVDDSVIDTQNSGFVPYTSRGANPELNARVYRKIIPIKLRLPQTRVCLTDKGTQTESDFTDFYVN